MTVYNGQKYVREALESVLEQDYRPIEVIVIDDGSTDATGEAVRPYSESVAVRYELREHRGTPAGRNAGLELARGDLIAFIDADDLWLPGKLSMQVNILDADASLDMVLGRAKQFISPDLSESEREGLRIMREEVVSELPTSSLMRRSVFDRVGLFSTRHPQASEMEWVTRAQEASLKIAVHDEVVYHRRIHAANMGRQTPGPSMRLHILKAALDRRRGKA
jgi:glycosyltransferase involved in cell wall biosynthesis